MKYIAIRQDVHDCWRERFDDKDRAIGSLKCQWEHLTNSEQRKVQCMYVLELEDSDEEDEDYFAGKLVYVIKDSLSSSEIESVNVYWGVREFGLETQKAVSFMRARIRKGLVLYAECPISDDLYSDTSRILSAPSPYEDIDRNETGFEYGALQDKIIEQVRRACIDPRVLSFPDSMKKSIKEAECRVYWNNGESRYTQGKEDPKLEPEKQPIPETARIR